MLSDIPQLEQTNIKTFLYNNLTIHTILSFQTLVSSGFEQNISKYRQRDATQKLAKSLLHAVLTFIDLYITRVETCFFLHIFRSISGLFFNDC